MPRPPKNPLRSLRRGQGYTEVRGETTVQARWFDGVRWRAKTFHGLTLEEATERAEEHIRIESKFVGDPDTQDATVADIVQAWLKRGKSRWSSNTYSQYVLHARNHVTPHLGHYRARDVTTARIQYWVDGLTDSGLKPGSVQVIATVVTGAFKEATRLGVIRTNPAIGIAYPAIRRTPKQTWTVEHIQTVFAALEDDAFWSAVYRFALSTGVRPGELIALRWADVDFEAGHATISRTLTRDEDRRYIIGTDTKTHTTRTVAVPPSTLAALRSWRTEQVKLRLASPFWLDDDLVFAATYGHHLSRKAWSDFHDALCKRLKVPRITLHGTRHSLATLMLAAREHPAVVQQILGHRSIKTTLDVYSHVDTQMQERAMAALDERLSAPKRVKN